MNTSTRPPFSTPPTTADIEALADEALETIPPELLQHVGGVLIRVEEFPDDDTLDEMGIEDPFGLLGLYHGIALGHKSVTATPQDLDAIYLYRRPLLDYWCETGEDLFHVVRHVLIHEIGHHFGFSDEDMEEIESRAPD